MLLQFLRSALEQRQLFQFDYDDKPRIVEPHALGLNKKGQMILRGWQVDEGWKLFILEKAETITIPGYTFAGPRPGYKAGDKAMSVIFAELPELVEQAA